MADAFRIAKSLLFGPQAAAPASPANGQMYYDSGLALFQFRQGGTWNAFGDVTLTGTQTLTNKTLTAPVIATIVNTGTLTLPTSTDTLVGRATTDTLTNKTLTSPAINTPTIVGGTHTAITSLSVRDTSAAFDVLIAATSSTALTANRTITWDVKDTAQSLKFTAASTITFPSGTRTLVSLDGTETLTNKTLTTPFIATVIGGTGAASSLDLQSTSGTGTSDAINFRTGTNGATISGSISSAGAWLIGPSGSQATHTIRGSITQLNSDATTTNSQLQILQNANLRLQIGVAGATNAFVPGSVAGDTVIRTASQSLLFTADGGTTLHGSLVTTGAWTLGPSAGGVTHRLNSNTTATGTATLTMANGPGSGTRAAVGYITINVNGTDRVIPFFATS